jgi:hypothetical protein
VSKKVVVVVPRSEPLKRAALNGLFGPYHIPFVSAHKELNFISTSAIYAGLCRVLERG